MATIRAAEITPQKTITATSWPTQSLNGAGRMTTRTTDIWIIVKCVKGTVSKRTTTASDTQMMAYWSNGFFRLAMAAILRIRFCYFRSRQRYKSSEERPVRPSSDTSPINQ